MTKEKLAELLVSNKNLSRYNTKKLAKNLILQRRKYLKQDYLQKLQKVFLLNLVLGKKSLRNYQKMVFLQRG